MKKLSRRAFLMGVSATTLALAMPSPAAAAPGKTIILEAVKGSDGTHRVKIPTSVASDLGKLRTAELTVASNRALKIAQSQNLTMPKANGVLTRLWSPSLRAAPKGIVPTLLQAGLILGFAWALQNAAGELANNDQSWWQQQTPSACSSLPAGTGNVWTNGSGTYRSGSQAAAYQRTTGISTGGTVTPPAGWTTAAQRNAVATEGGKFKWEVVYSKQIACGERVSFPYGPPEGAIPGPEHGANDTDTNSQSNVEKVADGMHKQAQKDVQDQKPLPGGEIKGEVEDPWNGNPEGVPPAQPVPQLDLGGFFDFGQAVGSYVAPRPVIGAEDTHVKFPPEIEFANPTTPETGTPTPTPSGSTPIDWGTPPSGDMPGVPTPFAWVPTPWAAPDLPGSCTGMPYNFTVVFRGAAGSINPCPAINMARPVIRPVAVMGWTAYAITQFLDL